MARIIAVNLQEASKLLKIFEEVTYRAIKDHLKQFKVELIDINIDISYLVYITFNDSITINILIEDRPLIFLDKLGNSLLELVNDIKNNYDVTEPFEIHLCIRCKNKDNSTIKGIKIIDNGKEVKKSIISLKPSEEGR